MLELEERLGLPSGDKSLETNCRPIAAPSSDVSFMSVEDMVPDGASCWKECAAALEGEIRRKSQLALELHHRVHGLETQLQRQQQATDERLASMHSSLEFVLGRLS